MGWTKMGQIFRVDGNHPWMQTHAQVPIADVVGPDRLRIYFGTRDGRNRTLTTYIEVRADDPRSVLYVHDRPILPLGRLGCFDDSGVMPSWITNHRGRKHFYYLGWNTASGVRYRVANGLAVSDDGGATFQRVSEGPIMDRTTVDPLGASTQCVLVDAGVWKTWYMSYLKWEPTDGTPEPFYHVRYAESEDGLHWQRHGTVCIDLKPDTEGGIARPCVLKENGRYQMWYSYRGFRGYRDQKQQSYRIGYAESDDGIHWTRRDDAAGIDVSASGWDSEMIAYAYVYRHNGKKHMLYNGNGFGRSGIGYAVMEPGGY